MLLTTVHLFIFHWNEMKKKKPKYACKEHLVDSILNANDANNTIWN